MGPKASEACNTARGKDDRTEAILLWAPREKAGFSEKMLGKIEGSWRRGRPHMET